jgi:hypothetical protein
MSHQRLITFAALVAIAFIVLDVYGYVAMLQARDRADEAVSGSALCERLANSITTLKAKPIIAGTHEQAVEELTKNIEAAAQAFGVAGNEHLASIAPEPTARLFNSAYLEKPTTVDLRNATLPQLIGMMCQLCANGSGLKIKTLRLTAPSKNDDNMWNAELTITYLIYSPLPDRQPRGEGS